MGDLGQSWGGGIITISYHSLPKPTTPSSWFVFFGYLVSVLFSVAEVTSSYEGLKLDSL